MATQAVADIASVGGILDTVSAILATDVDPLGIAADTTVGRDLPLCLVLTCMLGCKAAYLLQALLPVSQC